MESLAGRVVFFAVPAEEGGDLEWRLDDMDLSGHAADYEIVDLHLAYVMPARAMAAMVVDLLSDGARGAREVVANARPAMTRQQYVDFQRSVRRCEVYGGDGAA